ncbi:hypothetical protein GQX74_005423 [Glossina fuscipes]|nr:hypothetical protein GQX74_005423 [Glossina fuscipes]
MKNSPSSPITAEALSVSDSIVFGIEHWVLATSALEIRPASLSMPKSGEEFCRRSAPRRCCAADTIFPSVQFVLACVAISSERHFVSNYFYSSDDRSRLPFALDYTLISRWFVELYELNLESATTKQHIYLVSNSMETRALDSHNRTGACDLILKICECKYNVIRI